MNDLYFSKKILICPTLFEPELKFNWDKFKQQEDFLIRKPEMSFFSNKNARDFVLNLLNECITSNKNISIISDSKELIIEILKLESYKKYFVLVTKYGPVWFNHLSSCTNFYIEGYFI